MGELLPSYNSSKQTEPPQIANRNSQQSQQQLLLVQALMMLFIWLMQKIVRYSCKGGIEMFST